MSLMPATSFKVVSVDYIQIDDAKSRVKIAFAPTGSLSPFALWQIVLHILDWLPSYSTWLQHGYSDWALLEGETAEILTSAV
jgi:hypothetical protein